LTKFAPGKKQGTWEDFLTKTIKNNTIRMRQSMGERCLTEYKISEIINNRGLALALMELSPITGKTHQLRAQCSIHNLPIIGDRTYGNFSINKEFLRRFGQNRMFLHSESINLIYHLENTTFNFLATSICEFKNIVNIKLI
jgi:23S rRNA-/tRNA-specific pseudouridylate synthase